MYNLQIYLGTISEKAIIQNWRRQLPSNKLRMPAQITERDRSLRFINGVLRILLTYISSFLLLYQTKMRKTNRSKQRKPLSTGFWMKYHRDLWKKSSKREKAPRATNSPANFLSGQGRSHEDWAGTEEHNVCHWLWSLFPWTSRKLCQGFKAFAGRTSLANNGLCMEWHC